MVLWFVPEKHYLSLFMKSLTIIITVVVVVMHRDIIVVHTVRTETYWWHAVLENESAMSLVSAVFLHLDSFNHPSLTNVRFTSSHLPDDRQSFCNRKKTNGHLPTNQD